MTNLLNEIKTIFTLYKIAILDLFCSHSFKKYDKIKYTLNGDFVTATILEIDRFAGVYKVKWNKLDRVSFQTIYHIDRKAVLA